MAELDLAAVRAFVTAADEGQFGYAADLLGISQQAVSKRIAKLEGQLGVRLFDRAPSGSVVSAAGAKVLPYARSLLAVAGETLAAARPAGRALRVAVQDPRQADSVRYYLDRRPDADIELVIGTAFRSSRDALLNGRVDAAFARPHGGPRPLPAGIGIAPAFVDPFHLLVGKDHPLAGRPSITLADIVPYPSWAPGASIPSEWADFYRELTAWTAITILTGRTPGGAPEREDDRPAARGLAGKIAVLDRIAASDTLSMFCADSVNFPWHPHIRRLPVLNPTPAYPHALLWSTTDPHPALPDLIDHVRENYNGDILADCWIPEPDRAIFLP
ncbi:LysR family transcriptional regulator [Nocardia sp. NEAU-G5]|uniref:LysR family transcriptional regulator n=1 Tax=Nocardia albiluteola TaxID=2842303 RepID=A0ABS6B703_9NOCA|nr:LysR family transcriptional regulator [Nocardia albiluteola]MBU3064993.1 LysR family transcriptional regulator [Nocardia albiluteola]